MLNKAVFRQKQVAARIRCIKVGERIPMSNAIRGTIFFSIISVTAAAQGAEPDVHPFIAVSEEYTDNVFETNTNRITDYITRALPGVVMSYKAPALAGDLSYVFDYRYYARNSRDNELTHALAAKAKLTVENLLFLDVSDEYQRVSLDVTRDTTRESLFVNQSDRNVATASPYVVLHPTEKTMVKAGYRFIDTRYSASSAVDKMDHVGFLDAACEISMRFSLTAGYTFTRETADIDDFSQHQVLGGFRYEYADKSFVFAQGGNAWTRYDGGQRFNNIVWNAGINHVSDTVTGTVTTGVRYDEDPLRNIVQETFAAGSMEKRFAKGSLSFSPMYSEYVLTETDTLQTKKYGATARGQYELTSRLKSNLAVTVEKYELPLLGSHVWRYHVDSGVVCLLARQLTATLTYIYTEYTSPGIAAENRYVNRGMIEIRKTF